MEEAQDCRKNGSGGRGALVTGEGRKGTATMPRVLLHCWGPELLPELTTK